MNDKPYKQNDEKLKKLKRFGNVSLFYATVPVFSSFHKVHDLQVPLWRIGYQAHNRLFVFSLVTGNEIYYRRLLNYSADHDSYCQKGEYENV